MKLRFVLIVLLSFVFLGCAPTQWSDLRDSSAWGSLTVRGVRRVVQSGADVNERLERGSTPLMLAAENNDNPAVIEALVAAGADVHARNDEGETALIAVARRDMGADRIEEYAETAIGGTVGGRCGSRRRGRPRENSVGLRAG